MATLFGFLFLSSISIWVGSVVFFSFFATRQVDAALPPEQAIRVIAPMSGSYLRLGRICGAVAFGSSFFLPPVAGMLVTTRIVLVAAMFCVALYLAFTQGGRIRRVEEAVAAAGAGSVPKDALAAFDEFQGTAGQLNGAILLLGLLVVFISAFHA